MNIENLIRGEVTQNDLLNYYNATIVYDDLPKFVNGYVFNYDSVNFIMINKNLSTYRRKKTILHELTHIYLNQLGQANNDLLEFHRQDFEDEADRYIKFLKEIIENDK